MADVDFFSPTPTHNPLRFYLEAREEICVGRPGREFLMGGVGLGAAIGAMERATGRPLIWATAQYLSFVPPGSILDLDVRAPVMGNHASQARVVAHVGEREILTVNGALGSRSEQPSAQFAEMPEVPAPEQCPLREDPEFPMAAGLHALFEQRTVPSTTAPQDGRYRTWIRPTRAGVALSPGLLAIVADFLLAAVTVTLDRPLSTSSLDNTLRMHQGTSARGKEAGWLFCDTQMWGVASGFCHGQMNLFDQEGQLLATGSQSGIVRLR